MLHCISHDNAVCFSGNGHRKRTSNHTWIMYAFKGTKSWGLFAASAYGSISLAYHAKERLFWTSYIRIGWVWFFLVGWFLLSSLKQRKDDCLVYTWYVKIDDSVNRGSRKTELVLGAPRERQNGNGSQQMIVIFSNFPFSFFSISEQRTRVSNRRSSYWITAGAPV